MNEKREPIEGLIERMTSRIVNSLVIAAGLVALGIYASGPGDVDAPDYQIVSTSDGRVVRLNTETGSIVSCDAARCSLVLLRSNDLERARPPALPQAAAPPSTAQPAPVPAPEQSGRR